MNKNLEVGETRRRRLRIEAGVQETINPGAKDWCINIRIEAGVQETIDPGVLLDQAKGWWINIYPIITHLLKEVGGKG